MEYTINQLARLSGVSARTLRYYDEIGLLCPKRMSSNGYRIYGKEQVDLLQQILFYRELGFSLKDIQSIVASESFNQEQALRNHLSTLRKEQKRIEALIQNVNNTICSLKGEIKMTDSEKFEGFKREIITANEQKYGKEIRSKYGEETVAASNAKLANMTIEQWTKQEALAKEILHLLGIALNSGNPACEEAQTACDLHRQWICLFWPDGMYSKEAHMALVEGYLADERFKAYYDNAVGEGATKLLKEAMYIYTAQ